MFLSKRAIVPLLASGGIAAALFGGNAVSTAFTADTAGSATVNAARVTQGVTGQDFTLSGLLPGGTVATGGTDTTTITYKNTGTAPVSLWLTGESWQVNRNGTSGAAPNPGDLTTEVYFGTSTTGTPVATFNGNQLKNGANIELYGNIPVGGPYTVTLVTTLSQGAGNDWNNASVTVPYTLHAQDISGSDANGFVPTNNS